MGTSYYIVILIAILYYASEGSGNPLKDQLTKDTFKDELYPDAVVDDANNPGAGEEYVACSKLVKANGICENYGIRTYDNMDPLCYKTCKQWCTIDW